MAEEVATQIEVVSNSFPQQKCNEFDQVWVWREKPPVQWRFARLNKEGYPAYGACMMTMTVASS